MEYKFITTRDEDTRNTLKEIGLYEVQSYDGVFTFVYDSEALKDLCFDKLDTSFTNVLTF